MLLPCYNGKSTVALEIDEGKSWMKQIRTAIHEMVKIIGGEPLASPSRLAPKNTTRWAVGSPGFPVEYESVVELGILSKNDVWYFLDCEACLDAVDQIRKGKKLANLPKSLLQEALARKHYEVGESLAHTLDGDSDEDGIEDWGNESDWKDLAEDSDSSEDAPRVRRHCDRCQSHYWAAEWGLCPNCGDP